jgi:hypothetical protein
MGLLRAEGRRCRSERGLAQVSQLEEHATENRVGVLRADDEQVASGDRENPGVKAPKRARYFDWDPIRGLHHGQRTKRLHSKAVDMTARDRYAVPINPCATGAVQT